MQRVHVTWAQALLVLPKHVLAFDTGAGSMLLMYNVCQAGWCIINTHTQEPLEFSPPVIHHCFLCRLSPSDIHRLHASVTGRIVRVARRGTRFMASEYAAVHSRMDIMSENDRIVMEFDSREFGTVVQVRGSTAAAERDYLQHQCIML